MGLVVERGGAVHGAEIVPDQHVAAPPSMGEDEVGPGGELHQLTDQRAATIADVARQARAQRSTTTASAVVKSPGR